VILPVCFIYACFTYVCYGMHVNESCHMCVSCVCYCVCVAYMCVVSCMQKSHLTCAVRVFDVCYYVCVSYELVYRDVAVVLVLSMSNVKHMDESRHTYE